jgi:phage terminase large subunit-like protein
MLTTRKLMEKIKTNITKEELEQVQRAFVQKVRTNLPHLYGYKFYKWARLFFDSTNPNNLLCAANQISKSSTQIRKCIHWSTEVSLWSKLWQTVPRQFWYLYPSKDVSTAEFETKWVTEFMPRNEMEKHPKYGWQAKYQHGNVHHINWNSGLKTYFKTYSQDVHKLQSGTVHAMFTDEELPTELLDELLLRLQAVDGYFHMVFTATKGQHFWKQAIEMIGSKDEKFKDAFKQQVSMYDCLEYEDGDTNTPWTREKIDRVKSTCSTENEVLKRVYGRFVMDEGLKYPEFKRSVNVVKPYPIPSDWIIYGGVDIGSGGRDGHPSAIVFIAVRPDYKKGAVFRGWRGDGITTTSRDVLDMFRKLRGKMKLAGQYYDWANADFKTYAGRLGETFIKAEKSHEKGEDILNTLYKNQMLDIFDLPELAPLVDELMSLTVDSNKRHAKDDFIDAKRYTVTAIPWDWTACANMFAEYVEPPKKKTPEEIEIEVRRGTYKDERDNYIDEDGIGEEIDFYNSMMDDF